jgi:hypothetical protein
VPSWDNVVKRADHPRRRRTSCADLRQLATWFDQALDAKTTDEIFGAH